MHLSRLSISVASVLLGMIGCSSLVYAGDDCGAGYVRINFTGEGRTNTTTAHPLDDSYTDPDSLKPRSLGSLRLSGDYNNISLECGVTGVVQTIPAPDYDPEFPTFLPGFNVLTTEFRSIIACTDTTEAVITSTAKLQAGFCPPGTGIYAPGNPDTSYVGVNGQFEEPGTSFQGTWGLFRNAYDGHFSVWGTSICGIQVWNVEASACVKKAIANSY